MSQIITPVAQPGQEQYSFKAALGSATRGSFGCRAVEDDRKCERCEGLTVRLSPPPVKALLLAPLNRLFPAGLRGLDPAVQTVLGKLYELLVTASGKGNQL